MEVRIDLTSSDEANFKIENMKITLNVTISDEAKGLLIEVSKSEEPSDYTVDIFDEEGESYMDELASQGLIESVEGEQFYLTRLGNEFLKSI